MSQAADHVIDTYRNNESQLIYEKEWERARTMASHALAVDPEDTVRGKLRLCEGHLARINGTSHRSPQELNLAVEKFDEAQKLLPKSPDPELGLARVYVYGLKDIDKGYEALQEAQKRGYNWAIARNCCWPMATAIAPTAPGGIRAMCAACRRRRTRSNRPPTITSAPKSCIRASRRGASRSSTWCACGSAWRA